MMGVLNGPNGTDMGTSFDADTEKLTRAALSRVSSKALIKFVTAVGRYLPP